jgi:hypothetical protein
MPPRMWLPCGRCVRLGKRQAGQALPLALNLLPLPVLPALRLLRRQLLPARLLSCPLRLQSRALCRELCFAPRCKLGCPLLCCLPFLALPLQPHCRCRCREGLQALVTTRCDGGTHPRHALAGLRVSYASAASGRRSSQTRV